MSLSLVVVIGCDTRTVRIIPYTLLLLSARNGRWASDVIPLVVAASATTVTR
jgi:hypothetical protein